MDYVIQWIFVGNSNFVKASKQILCWLVWKVNRLNIFNLTFYLCAHHPFLLRWSIWWELPSNRPGIGWASESAWICQWIFERLHKSIGWVQVLQLLFSHSNSHLQLLQISYSSWPLLGSGNPPVCTKWSPMQPDCTILKRLRCQIIPIQNAIQKIRFYLNPQLF